MIIDFIIEDLLLDSYLQKNFHTPEKAEANALMSLINMFLCYYYITLSLFVNPGFCSDCQIQMLYQIIVDFFHFGRR